MAAPLPSPDKPLSLDSLPDLVLELIANQLDAASLCALSSTCSALRPLSRSQLCWEALCRGNGWHHQSWRKDGWLSAYQTRQADPGCGRVLVSRVSHVERITYWGPDAVVPETRSVQLLRVASAAPSPGVQKPWWRRLWSGSSPPPREDELRVDGVTFATLDPLGQSLALTAGGAYMVYRLRGLRGASPSFSAVAGTPGTPDSMFFSACSCYLASHFSHHTGASMLTLQHVPPLPPRDNHRGVPLTEAQQLLASPGALSLAFSPAADVMAVLRASSALPELYVFRLGATAAGLVSASRFTLVRTLEDANRPTAAPGRVPLSTAPLFSHDGRHLWYVSALGGGAILEAVDVSQVEEAPLVGGDPAMPPWPVWTIDLGLDPMGDPPTHPYQLAASPNGRFISGWWTPTTESPDSRWASSRSLRPACRS